MSSEDPETYLRRFAETQLRRLAAGEATAAECAARVDSVAVAFTETGALNHETAARVTDGFSLALAGRSPGWEMPGRRQGRALVLSHRPGFAEIFSRRGPRPPQTPPLPWNPAGEVTVRPAGAVLRPRDEGADEDVWLLAYVSAPGRAWFSVAARTSAPRAARRHASPPSSRNPRVRPASRPSSPFAGNRMTAADDAGREYRLGFAGGGSEWYTGRLSVHPVPPPDAAWLEVRCDAESARIDLRAEAPAAEVSARPRAGGPGEFYLLQQAETLLGHPAPLAAGVAPATTVTSVVPALRAAGLLADDSPVPGQFAALAERLGAPVPGAVRRGQLPEQWASFLGGAEKLPDDGPVTAASLTAVLPEADGVAVHLAGLLTRPGAGTTLFGGVRAQNPPGGQTLWLRDDAGGWHRVSVQGWSDNRGLHTFQASVEPAIGPEVSRVEFRMTGAETEVRAGIPVRWWTS